MAIVMSKLYAALRAADVPDKEAAEEADAFETRLSSLFADIRLLQWRGGFNIALSIAILMKLFTQ